MNNDENTREYTQPSGTPPRSDAFPPVPPVHTAVEFDDAEEPASGKAPDLCRFLEQLSPAARGFVLTFAICAVILLFVSLGVLLYQRGKNDSLRENGTYDEGYAAALEERGTYQEGWDAALRENGTYADGYAAGLAKGKVEGYEKGHADGLRDAVTEENMHKQEENASSAAPEGQESSEPSSDAPDDSERVWIPRLIGSHYHHRKNCPLLIDPVETTLKQADAEGYKPCRKCVK